MMVSTVSIVSTGDIESCTFLGWLVLKCSDFLFSFFLTVEKDDTHGTHGTQLQNEVFLYSEMCNIGKSLEYS